MSQPGFFDLGERYRGLDAKKDPLVVLNAVVPWEDFRAQLSAVWRKPEEERKTAAGRKPWDEIVIFKTLVLQALYNLSDDQVEYQIRDRLSFMRFLGLGSVRARANKYCLTPTRVKADSFWGFQNRASLTLWWRAGGSPCGQGLRFAQTMTQLGFGAWRKRPETRLTHLFWSSIWVGACFRE